MPRPRPAILLCLLCLVLAVLSVPAAAKAPEPVEVPPDLPPAIRAELKRQSGDLALVWEGLVDRVRAHNQTCAGVMPNTPQAQRCAANMADIRKRVGEYLKAVERFNLRVAAATIKRNEVKGEGPATLLLPADDEIALGRQAAEMVGRQCVLNRDPRVNKYIQRLGWKLSRFSGRPDLPYSFQVIDRVKSKAGKGIRRACGLACSWPGGIIYLNRAALKYARTESELAGVLAHEIGHVAARHQAVEMVKLAKTQGLSLSSARLSSVPVLNGLVGMWVKELASFSYSRDQEREADRRAVEMLFRAGFQPSGLFSFFWRLSRGKKNPWRRLYAVHPPPPGGAKALEPLLADPRFKRIKHKDSAQFKQVRRKLTRR